MGLTGPPGRAGAAMFQAAQNLDKSGADLGMMSAADQKRTSAKLDRKKTGGHVTGGLLANVTADVAMAVLKRAQLKHRLTGKTARAFVALAWA